MAHSQPFTETMLLTDTEGNQYTVPVTAVQPVHHEPVVTSHPNLAVVGSLFSAIGDLANIGSKTIADMSGSKSRTSLVGSLRPVAITASYRFSNGYAVTCYADNKIDVLLNGKPIFNKQITESISSVCELPDDCFAVGTTGGLIYIINLLTQNVLQLNSEQTSSVTALLSLNNGMNIAVGTAIGLVYIINISTKNISGILQSGLKSSVTALLSLNNGMNLAVGYSNGTTIIFEIITNKKLQIILGKTNVAVISLKLLRDSRLEITYNDGNVVARIL